MADYEIDIDKARNGRRGFVHPPIDASTQIRLLRIPRRDDSGDPGRANYRLEVFRVADLPRIQYRALSYMWGAARGRRDVRDVRVDGQPFAVRRNLADFLAMASSSSGRRRMRAAGGLFFVDAVCIDQLSVAEREAQVRLMARVFRCADEVVIWLGALSKDPAAAAGGHYADVRALALATTTRLRDRSPTHARKRTARADGRQNRGSDRPPPYHSHSSNTKNWTAAEWAGLHHLSHHPYWRRIWVVQEIQLATRGVVWCGPFKFPLSLLATSPPPPPTLLQKGTCGLNAEGSPYAVQDARARAQSPAAVIVTHRLRQVPRPAPSSHYMPRVGTLREMTAQLAVAGTTSSSVMGTYHSHVPDLLHEVVRLFGGLDCTDPRDRLYGLLGLLRERSAALVVPDYGRGVEHAIYQALRVGILEIAHEMRPVPGGVDDAVVGGIVGFGPRAAGDPSGTMCSSSSSSPLWRERERAVRDACLAYYCAVRDAFAVPDARCAGIFGRVLRELKRWGRGPVLWDYDGDGDDRAFVRMIPRLLRNAGWMFGDDESDGEDDAVEKRTVGENWLHRYHDRQRDVAERM